MQHNFSHSYSRCSGVAGQVDGCSGFVIEPAGILTAPDSNNDTWYDNNAECVWIIEVSDSRSIRIQFLEIDIENEMVCEYDRLQVRSISLQLNLF